MLNLWLERRQLLKKGQHQVLRHLDFQDLKYHNKNLVMRNQW